MGIANNIIHILLSFDEVGKNESFRLMSAFKEEKLLITGDLNEQKW